MANSDQREPRLEDMTTLEEAVAYVNHFSEKAGHLQADVEFWRKRSDGWERYAKELEEQIARGAE